MRSHRSRRDEIHGHTGDTYVRGSGPSLSSRRTPRDPAKVWEWPRPTRPPLLATRLHVDRRRRGRHGGDGHTLDRWRHWLDGPGRGLDGLGCRRDRLDGRGLRVDWGDGPPGRSVRASPHSPLPPGAASAASATSLAMRSAWGGMPAASAGPIGDIASRDSVAAASGTGATAAAAGGRTDAASETGTASAGEAAAATGDAARRTRPPAGCWATLAGETSPCDVSAIESTKPLRSHSWSTLGLRRWRPRCSACPEPCWRRRSPIQRRSKVTPRRSGRADATSRRALKVRFLPAFTTNT